MHADDRTIHDLSPAPATSVVDIYVASQSYKGATRRRDTSGKSYSWYALAVSSDGREAVGSDGYRALAVAEAVGELIKEGKGQTTYRIFPHDRIHHRLGTACRCDLCQLLGSDPAYGNVEIVPGSHEALPRWEAVSTRCADRVIEEGVANTRTLCHGVPIPCTEIRDEGGIVTSRTLPARLRDEVVIASDASLSTARNSRGVAAAAAVSSDGRYLVSRVDTKRAGVPAIDFAELTAIHLALRNWIGRARHLIIRSDSQKALGLIERARSGVDVGSTGRALGTVTRVAEMIVAYEKLGGQITLEWVKGHSGDPLNEGADRLAIHARRAAEWGTFDDPVIAEQCRQFADETVANYRRSLTSESVLEEQNLGRVEVPAA